VGAAAAPGVMAHPWKEKIEENLWMMVRTWTNWNLRRELLWTSWPQGGSSGSGWRRKNSHGKDGETDCRRSKHSPWEGREGDTLLGYWGQAALKREQCDTSTHCQQRVGKQVAAKTDSW
jgi:hypothetical protein